MASDIPHKPTHIAGCLMWRACVQGVPQPSTTNWDHTLEYLLMPALVAYEHVGALWRCRDSARVEHVQLHEAPSQCPLFYMHVSLV